GGHITQMTAIMDPKQRHKEADVVRNVNKLGYLVPGARISAGGAQGGGGADVTYALSGPPDLLQSAAEKLRAFIARIPNTTNVQTSAQVAGPRLDIRVDRNRAATLAVSPGAAATIARASVGGVIATKVRQPEGLVNAVVQFP